VIDYGPERPQLAGGDHDLTPCRDDVFDHGDALAPDVGALGKLRSAICLCLLAHERCR
jgi:hypothetical protein